MTLKEAWKLYSVKLAAFIGTLSAVIAANPDLAVGLLAIIPVDPVHRLILSAGVGILVFLIPTIARLWPQGDTDER